MKSSYSLIADEGDEEHHTLLDGKTSIQPSPSSSSAVKEHTFLEAAEEMVRFGPLNFLLMAAPFAFLAGHLGMNDHFTFLFAVLSIAPFSERLGFVTEQLSLHMNPIVGGLVTVSAGNATELILALVALKKGYFRIIQLSLLGSVMSSLLLILGSSLFYGGIFYKFQRFSKASARTGCSLLLLGASAFLLPNMLFHTQEVDATSNLDMSRSVSVILLLVYISYLYFQVNLITCNFKKGHVYLDLNHSLVVIIACIAHGAIRRRRHKRKSRC